MMVHPAKAHNAIGALVDMYGEALTAALNENAQLRAGLEQREKDLAQFKHAEKSWLAARGRLITRVEEVESELRAAREGAVREADDGRVGDAERTEGGGALHDVRREVADDVRDGECPQPHPTLRDSSPPSGPANASSCGPEDFGGTDAGSHLDNSGGSGR